jgi:hypothetical protein
MAWPSIGGERPLGECSIPAFQRAQTGDFVPQPGEVVKAGTKTPNPVEFSLEQNYPNPFNPGTRIGYSVKRLSHVEIKIYNQLGQLIRTLVNEKKSAGSFSAIWDGKSDFERQVASGVYICEMKIGGKALHRKMVLL